ncbi:MAG: tetraacyldisaccharide 4'-kinase [Alphaproteobacteria bacterium]|nr:tetraacyldisaccharide 4'-kinase [Alphaproteobacteria bacterium]
MATPKFWTKSNNWLVKVLKPFGAVYAWSVARRLRRKKAYHAPIPVVCVGNIFVGGVGKTPVCLALGKLLYAKGLSFYYLNHGYKAEKRNVLVDPQAHSAMDVGDEALLLSEVAPTIVSQNRAKGAKLAEKWGAKALIMDDGFQNPTLYKDFSFVVVDGKKGFGNEQVLPAGPLREPALVGLKRANAVILAGEDTWGVRFFLERNQIDLPVLTGHFELDDTVVSMFRGQKVFAFAGLGNPEKFYQSLRDKGIIVGGTQDFPDHYYYTRFDLEDLKHSAAGMPLMTTEKDGVKVPKDIRQNVFVMPGQFVFDDPEKVWDLLKGVLNVASTSSKTDAV